jgi:hypothetical protein
MMFFLEFISRKRCVEHGCDAFPDEVDRARRPPAVTSPDAKTDGALPSDVGVHLEDRPTDSLFDITNVGSTRPATG